MGPSKLGITPSACRPITDFVLERGGRGVHACLADLPVCCLYFGLYRLTLLLFRLLPVIFVYCEYGIIALLRLTLLG
jgi:hypothetical protein